MARRSFHNSTATRNTRRAWCCPASSSAVLPTRLFGYFSVFQESHRVVLPGNVRFQTGEGLSRDWCSPEYLSIHHSAAKAMGTCRVRPSPSVLGSVFSNLGSVGAGSARKNAQLHNRKVNVGCVSTTAAQEAEMRHQYYCHPHSGKIMLGLKAGVRLWSLRQSSDESVESVELTAWALSKRHDLNVYARMPDE